MYLCRLTSVWIGDNDRNSPLRCDFMYKVCIKSCIQSGIEFIPNTVLAIPDSIPQIKMNMDRVMNLIYLSVKWGASYGLSSYLYCRIWNSDQMTFKKTYSLYWVIGRVTFAEIQQYSICFWYFESIRFHSKGQWWDLLVPCFLQVLWCCYIFNPLRWSSGVMAVVKQI